MLKQIIPPNKIPKTNCVKCHIRNKQVSYGSVRLMLRPTGQSDKIQSIKSSQYIGSIGSIGSIGYIGSIVHTGNIPPVK